MEKLIHCERCGIKHPASTQEMKIYSVLAECDDELFNEDSTGPFIHSIGDEKNCNWTCLNCKNKFVKYGIAAVQVCSWGGVEAKFCVPCKFLFENNYGFQAYYSGSTLYKTLSCPGSEEMHHHLGEILNLRRHQKNVKAVLILLNHKVLPNDLVRTLKSFLY